MSFSILVARCSLVRCRVVSLGGLSCIVPVCRTASHFGSHPFPVSGSKLPNVPSCIACFRITPATRLEMRGFRHFSLTLCGRSASSPTRHNHFAADRMFFAPLAAADMLLVLTVCKNIEGGMDMNGTRYSDVLMADVDGATVATVWLHAVHHRANVRMPRSLLERTHVAMDIQVFYRSFFNLIRYDMWIFWMSGVGLMRWEWWVAHSCTQYM